MTSLQQGAEDYLKMRRGLGFKRKRHSRLVREFIAWLERNGETRIRTRLALQWATEPQHLHQSEWAARLSGVRVLQCLDKTAYRRRNRPATSRLD